MSQLTKYSEQNTNTGNCWELIMIGHMEKQETEMKRKLEMEIGNGNEKRKWEQKTHQSLVQCFLHSVRLVITLVIYLAMAIGLAL